ncbi:hypothetical protein TWF281_004522 [Arthrobotrys megalospora]
MMDLPLEIQFSILEAADWDQHPVLIRVCKAWKDFLCAPNSTTLLKRYTNPSLRSAEDPNGPLYYFASPLVHNFLFYFTNLTRSEAGGKLHACRIDGDNHIRLPRIFQNDGIVLDSVYPHKKNDNDRHLIIRDPCISFNDSIFGRYIELEDQNPTIKEFVEALEQTANTGIDGWREEGYFDAMVLNIMPMFDQRETGSLLELRILGLDYL